MDFEPINADHAIESVAFTVALDRVFSVDEVSSFRRNHKMWRGDLPAVAPCQALVVKINQQSGIQEQTSEQGIEFSHVRTDGSPAWVLRMVGQEITVECHRYTRWDRVWERAKQHICQTFDLLKGSTSPLNMLVLSLNVSDKFRALREQYDLMTLFERSEMLPTHVFTASPTWHNHHGWFEQEFDGPILNLLNLDAIMELRPDADSGEAKQGLFVRLMHMQQKRFRQPQPLGDQLEQTKQTFGNSVSAMHQNNKQLMQRMLTQAMKDRIGLNG